MQPCGSCATRPAQGPRAARDYSRASRSAASAARRCTAAAPRIRYATYRCTSGAPRGALADPVDEYVTELTLARLTQPDAAELWTAELPDAAELMTEADTLRRRRDDIALDYADGVMTREQFRTANARVLERLGEVEAQIAAAGSVLAAGDRRRRGCQSHVADSLGGPAARHHRRADDPGAAPARPRHAHVPARNRRNPLEAMTSRRTHKNIEIPTLTICCDDESHEQWVVARFGKYPSGAFTGIEGWQLLSNFYEPKFDDTSTQHRRRFTDEAVTVDCRTRYNVKCDKCHRRGERTNVPVKDDRLQWICDSVAEAGVSSVSLIQFAAIVRRSAGRKH